MNYLYPKIPLKRLPSMIRWALLGAVVAGLYGSLHDQISYAISPEYFTKFKFRQFSYANFGWPPRLFVAEIGFLATFWVGLIGGWLLARVGLDELSGSVRRNCALKSFAIVMTVAPVFGTVGAMLGLAVTGSNDFSGWSEVQRALDIQGIREFVVVAYLHAAGYLGALVGLVLAVAYVRRCRRRLIGN